tara:strand:- start:480 stop:629 length:150 start_codon:yes stop_codon:yes gene_type:complete
MIIPARLEGDEIRVIATSRSLSMISKDTVNIALKTLNDFGGGSIVRQER